MFPAAPAPANAAYGAGTMSGGMIPAMAAFASSAAPAFAAASAAPGMAGFAAASAAPGMGGGVAAAADSAASAAPSMAASGPFQQLPPGVAPMLFPYTPSFIIALIGAVAFTISFVIHLVQLFRTKSWYFSIVVQATLRTWSPILATVFRI